MTPKSSCSGRLTGQERQFVVTRELSVPGAQGADGQKNGSGPGRVDERAWSLYPTSTRFGAPAVFGSNRICQNMVLADKTPRFTPALTAAVTLSRISFDQYSS